MDRLAIQKHKETMLAYADGAKVEIYDSYNNSWLDCDNPNFHFNSNYRIKPKKLSPWQVYMNAQYPDAAPHTDSAMGIKGFEAVIKAAKNGEFD